MKLWRGRIFAVIAIASLLWYIPWLLANLNWQAPWLSVPFALAALLMASMVMITSINHWSADPGYALPIPPALAPEVAIIIPTYGEPPEMVRKTAESVLGQEYPTDRIRLVISDDGHRLAIQELLAPLGRAFPSATIVYHEPPLRGAPSRKGEAKAGNLNSALELIQSWAVPPDFVETRDADDLVGDPQFLASALQQLVSDRRLAFIQSIKEAQISPGDPFGNLEPLFYRKALLARNAANAVFPCGSGLVWRREALEEIDGFPAWNLVEDLQSGVEALRRGWRGAYLPIVGAIGQIAPEDTANAIKQRGTWALDTMRLTFWADKRGLSLRQHVQFAELGFFYILSFAVLTFAITPVVSLLFGVYPIVTTNARYALHFWPVAAAIELMLVNLADGLPFEVLWRARQTWVGMAPVYARATLIALRYGPHRKPTYRVTRKEHVYRWYWREVLPQALLVTALVVATGVHLLTHSLLHTADLGSLFWAAFFVLALSRTLVNSWHGVDLLQTMRRWLRPKPNRGLRTVRSQSQVDRATKRR